MHMAMPASPVPVLLHGFLFADCGPFRYFRGVEKAMRRQGMAPLLPRVPLAGSVERRAAALGSFLAQRCESTFVLLGHSMGGLDGRFLIANHDPDHRVRLLTTVATPHRGTEVAQATLSGRGPVSVVARRYWSDALRDLTPSVRARQPIPDRADVTYYSYNAVRPVGELPLLARTFLPPIAGANDGMVPAASAVWGEHRGTLHADHFESVGWSLALPRRQAARPFDHIAFWLHAAAEAIGAAQGEETHGKAPALPGSG
jgi:triacylglycerol lipase